MTTIAARQTVDKPSTRTPAFSMSRKGNVIVVRLTGPRVGEREAGIASPQVRQSLNHLSGNLKGLVLDLSNVKVMSSYGLGLCIELRNLAASFRAGTVLYGMCPDIRELFRVMRLDRLFTIAITAKQLPPGV